ncbi:MAG: PrkA family serine protein kinase [Halobacteria archaeon]
MRRGSDRARKSSDIDGNGEKWIDRGDDSLDTAYREPIDLATFVDEVLEDPSLASQSAKYLLDAVESMGVRTVIEEGERKKRYRFFDDPKNDGEHAILGNTDVLNRFVDTLRSIASGRGKDEKIIWVDGPTATGKSEFKRCLINGLREFSKTPEGRRFTVEWNVSSMHEWGSDKEDNWYTSPVQVNPLAVFPDDVRRELVETLNENSDGHVDVEIPGDLDPFSREAYNYLEEKYRRQGTSRIFSAVTDPKHLRVKNHVVDVGDGIGVLHSEDAGAPKERLVGVWMQGMLQKLDSRGRKNPQAFSYDGVVSQGNGVLSIVEDAIQHADLLQRLLNVSDEETVKLDKGIRMDIDTLLLVISNPDLESQLESKSEMVEKDPLKALKRRLEKHNFRYLTNLSLEVDLLRREITNRTGVWETENYEEIARRMRSPIFLKVTRVTEVREREIAPHAVEAAAMYSVVTRLVDTEADIDLVEKAVLFDQGYIKRGDDRLEKSDFQFDDGTRDGVTGIPVTYTRDIVADLLYEKSGRSHTEYDVSDVVMPEDILMEMSEALDDEPMFSKSEREEFRQRLDQIFSYLQDKQERDVLDALMRDKRVEDETVAEYVEHVFAWVQDGMVVNERGQEVPPDDLKMKVFEIEDLGRFDESDYDGEEPSSEVEEFRRENIVTAMNVHAWQQRTEDFDLDDVDPREIPVIEQVLSSYSWEDVHRLYEDFDPSQWEDPPANTETERVKEMTIENMMDMYDYTRASAALTSKRVMEDRAMEGYTWD